MTSALSTKGLPRRQLSKSVIVHSLKVKNYDRLFRQISIKTVGKATVYSLCKASNYIKCTSGSLVCSGLISETPSFVYKFSLTLDSTLILKSMFIGSFCPHSMLFGMYASKFLREEFIVDNPDTRLDSLSIFAPKY